ncbi:hypothetical protein FQZ97_958350 [compost metagenome]
MPLNENGIQILDPIVLLQHCIDDRANLIGGFPIRLTDLIVLGVKTEELIGDAQDSLVLTDNYLDIPCAKLLNGLLQNGLADLFGLLQIRNFLNELFLPLLQLFLDFHQLQNQDHRGQDEDHQQRRHDVREGHPVGVLLVDSNVMRLTRAHQRASSSSRMPPMAWAVRCIWSA